MCQLINEPSLNITSELIEAYVKKDYYPISDCLAICQDHGQDRAVSALLERNGDFIKAIQTYMKYV